MEKVKDFKGFMNEELDTKTYRNAAAKLKQKGHNSRATNIGKYADKQQLGDLMDKKITYYPEGVPQGYKSPLNRFEIVDKDGSIQIWSPNGRCVLDIKHNDAVVKGISTLLRDRESAFLAWKLLKLKGANLPKTSVNDFYKSQ